MIDIIERLRRTANLGLIDGGLMEEAANEIERLREALRIARCPYCGTDYTPSDKLEKMVNNPDRK